MHRITCFSLAVGLLLIPVLPSSAQTAKPGPPQVAATIATTFSTNAGHIRQFAFDGDTDTYFESKENAGRLDHFTLTFDRPVTVKSIAVTTGKPDGAGKLDEGLLEFFGDNKKWEQAAKFKDGEGSANPKKRISAVRIRPATDLEHPLAIREFTIESDPPLAIFQYPVEFFVIVDDAPQLKKWAERVAHICERAYPMINDELKSEGFKPATVVTLTMKSDYNGVAYTSGNNIVGSVKFFESHSGDVGAMVHETVHVCQRYRGKYPGWLVEGIADYIRFFKFEPGKLGPINPTRARYDGSYRTTASFLAYVSKKCDKELVRKLNKYAREGEYKDEVFKLLSKKSLQQLNDEWRATLTR